MARLLGAAAVVLAASATPADSARPSDPLRDRQWYLDKIHASDARGRVDGTGVTVAVLDSGVDAGHPDLAGRVDIGPDLVDGAGAGRDPNGHGTNIAGIIAAGADNGVGIAGVAPGARILTVRVLDADLGGSTAREARGIDAAVAAGAQVINLSLGPSPDVLRALSPLDPLAPAIQRAANAGVVVVGASGNYALPLCLQPVLVSGLLCVGAVNRELARTDYADFGVRVDVVAPGGDGMVDDGIYSTAPGGGYNTLIGTSQASPQAAGMAALLISAGLHGQAVIDRIMQTALDLGPRGEDLSYGHGMLDIGAALAGLVPPAQAAPSSQPSPQLVSVRVPSGVRRSILLRRGVRIRVRVTTTGRFRARLTVSRTALARADERLSGERTHTMALRPVRHAARLLARKSTVIARLTVVAPDGTKLVKRIKIRR